MTVDKKTIFSGYNGFGEPFLNPPMDDDVKRFCSQFSWYLDLLIHSAGHLHPSCISTVVGLREAKL